MNNDYLPTKNIDSITKIKNLITLTDDETENMNNHIVKFLNSNTDTIVFEWAVINGKIQIVHNLINKYINDNYDKCKPYVEQAIQHGHINILNYFINYFKHQKKYDNLLDISLDYAIEYNKLEIVMLLVSKGVSVTRLKYFYVADQPIIGSIKKNHFDIAEYLIKNNSLDNNNKIITLNRGGGLMDENILKMLIENCNMDGEYKDHILICCARIDNLDKAKYLIENGLDISAHIKTTLKECISRSSLKVLEYLLEVCLERNLPIPDKLITEEITKVNELLIKYVTEDKYDLFNPVVLKTLNNLKSARNC